MGNGTRRKRNRISNSSRRTMRMKNYGGRGGSEVLWKE